MISLSIQISYSMTLSDFVILLLFFQSPQENKLMNSLHEYQVPLQRYVALMDLQEKNEKLFYKLLIDNVEELLPVVYGWGKVLEVLKN
ncbi:uncharacterized protein A4U43_C03F15440 [Asparagus officinalis]|uniref:Uncharacterized protein n=1 Tax=Asparagus officinalis TaxID=4686 RepID=A0A5P1FAU9_ASPOF|nr:uncharacterized protein A4U43_C03F15440 [Asparagus officinalis]